MANILTATVTIKGTRPLWWHAFTENALPLEKKEREGVAGNSPNEWKETVLATSDRQLYVLASYIFGCVRDGSKNIKKGRGSIQPAVCSTLQVQEEMVLVDRFLPDGDPPRDPTQPVYLDVRGVKNPATRARNVRYRVAASPGWRATFTLLWDKTVVSRGELESATRDAGMLAGLGDGRSIGMGRFAVESFEVSEAR